MVASSLPCVPPAYTVSFTRPAVFCSHSAPMSRSALCHDELTGAWVASLSVTTAASEMGITSPAATATRATALRTDIDPPIKVRLKPDTTYPVRLKPDTTYPVRLKPDTTYPVRLKPDTTYPV